MLRNTNLNLLRTLHVLLQEVHVSNAARRLHVTQSAVSRQLAQLRDIWRDDLLVRDGNQLVLTPKAVMLKARLDNLMDDFDALVADTAFDPANWFGNIVLSSSDYVAQFVLPDICRSMQQQAPNLTITLGLWEPEYIHQLHQRNIDVAFTMLPEKPEGVSGLQTGTDQSVLVMHESHPLAAVSSVDVHDLVTFPFIKITGGADKDTFVDEQLSAWDLKRTISLRVPFFNAALSALQHSQSLLVMPLHIVRSLSVAWNLTYKPLPVTTPGNKYWLIWHARYDNDIRHKWVREQIRLGLTLSKHTSGHNKSNEGITFDHRQDD